MTDLINIIKTPLGPRVYYDNPRTGSTSTLDWLGAPYHTHTVVPSPFPSIAVVRNPSHRLSSELARLGLTPRNAEYYYNSWQFASQLPFLSASVVVKFEGPWKETLAAFFQRPPLTEHLNASKWSPTYFPFLEEEHTLLGYPLG